MAVKIRMTRMGRRHRPFFRMNAIDSRTPRDGTIIEKLGHYDPLEKAEEKQYVLNKERIEFWLSQGAVPSDTVAEILDRHGIKTKYAAEKAVRKNRARELARKAGKPYTKAEKEAAAAAAEEAKKAAEAAKKAAAAPKA